MQTSLICKNKKEQLHARGGRYELFCIKALFKLLPNSQNTETPLLGCLSNNVANIQAINSIKKRLQHRCFPANFANILRIFF